MAIQLHAATSHTVLLVETYLVRRWVRPVILPKDGTDSSPQTWEPINQLG